MTGATPNDHDANFAATYDGLVRAWVAHEDLRRAGAPISELYRSSLHLSQAREQMWSWWAQHRVEGVR